uniref:Uncharacterized protein n=1 Tax=Setaria viridis TaxID=4556 RepID=A0A4U6V6M5_SETVI|nr:hypothetical protein SEVIR_4G239300v2 [Setaria viridis]
MRGHNRGSGGAAGAGRENNTAASWSARWWTCVSAMAWDSTAVVARTCRGQQGEQSKDVEPGRHRSPLLQVSPAMLGKEIPPCSPVISLPFSNVADPLNFVQRINEGWLVDTGGRRRGPRVLCRKST